MRWDAHEIARFARGAGFHGDDVTMATAIALATSGGVATYDHRAGLVGTGHWRGLWGIDVDRYPDYAERDLLVPHEAAKAAHELCEALGNWQWSPVYRAGTHVHYAAEAGTARTREVDYQRPALPFTFPQTDEAVRRAHVRLANLRAALTTVRPRWR